MNKTNALILSILLTILIANSIYFLNLLNSEEKSTILVKEVTDGDTLVSSENEKIRLVNINTPEKSESGYEEAKFFLKQFENKTLQIESLSTDKYQRTLARLYFDKTYLNLEIIDQGLGTKFLVQESETQLFSEAETGAINSEKGIWEHSKYFGCLSSEIDAENEIIALSNSCPEINFDGWTLRDESRKKYKFPPRQFTKLTIITYEGKDNSNEIYLNEKQSVWNNDRDTLYVFDQNHNLVHFNSYGY